MSPAKAIVVLYVEDDVLIRELVEITLQEFGFEVVGAADGTTALDALRLMLSDIVMAGPMTGGPGPRRSQRASRPSRLLATGYSEAAGQAAAEFTVLRKPYNAADLDQAIFDARRRQAARQRKVVDFQTTKRERAAKGK